MLPVVTGSLMAFGFAIIGYFGKRHMDQQDKILGELASHGERLARLEGRRYGRNP